MTDDSAPNFADEYKGSHRRLAREIFWDHHDRANYECPDCGRTEDECLEPFEVHHESGVPVDNSPENLIALCRPCHNIREGKKPSLAEIANLRNQINGLDHDEQYRKLLQSQTFDAKPADYHFKYLDERDFRNITTGVLRGEQSYNRCDLCGGLFPRESVKELFEHVAKHDEQSAEAIDPFHKEREDSSGLSDPLSNPESVAEPELVPDRNDQGEGEYVIEGDYSDWEKLPIYRLGVDYLILKEEYDEFLEAFDEKIDREETDLRAVPGNVVATAIQEVCQQLDIELKGPVKRNNYRFEESEQGKQIEDSDEDCEQDSVNNIDFESSSDADEAEINGDGIGPPITEAEKRQAKEGNRNDGSEGESAAGDDQ